MYHSRVIEEIGFKAVEHSPSLMSVLLTLLRDGDVVVVKQSIVSGTNIFSSAFEEMILQVLWICVVFIFLFVPLKLISDQVHVMRTTFYCSQWFMNYVKDSLVVLLFPVIHAIMLLLSCPLLILFSLNKKFIEIKSLCPFYSFNFSDIGM